MTDVSGNPVDTLFANALDAVRCNNLPELIELAGSMVDLDSTDARAHWILQKTASLLPLGCPTHEFKFKLAWREVPRRQVIEFDPGHGGLWVPREMHWGCTKVVIRPDGKPRPRECEYTYPVDWLSFRESFFEFAVNESSST